MVRVLYPTTLVSALTNLHIGFFNKGKVKGKVIPLQARCGPEVE
jgi:hypothetical protein